MTAAISLECIAQRPGADAAVVFAHGLDGDAVATWGAFPARLAAEIPSAEVFTLSWPAALAKFTAEAAHTIPAIATPLAGVLMRSLSGYARVHLVLHCLGAPAVIAALHRAAGNGFTCPLLTCTLIDAPLLAPDATAPAWLAPAMKLMGLEPEMLIVQTRWLDEICAAPCQVLRGADAKWIDHCAPFALSDEANHHHVPLDHTALAAAPVEGPFAPLSLLLTYFARPIPMPSGARTPGKFPDLNSNEFTNVTPHRI
jgi:hypothetical protein